MRHLFHFKAWDPRTQTAAQGRLVADDETRALELLRQRGLDPLPDGLRRGPPLLGLAASVVLLLVVVGAVGQAVWAWGAPQTGPAPTTTTMPAPPAPPTASIPSSLPARGPAIVAPFPDALPPGDARRGIAASTPASDGLTAWSATEDLTAPTRVLPPQATADATGRVALANNALRITAGERRLAWELDLAAAPEADRQAALDAQSQLFQRWLTGCPQSSLRAVSAWHKQAFTGAWRQSGYRAETKVGDTTLAIENRDGVIVTEIVR